jgi:general stress protein YciG
VLASQARKDGGPPARAFDFPRHTTQKESMSETTSSTTKLRRGFAVMHPDVQRQIASIGGRTAHEKGTAHQFTSEEAREAGRKGGTARAAARKARG